MWFYMLIGALAILAIAGAALMGGVFTIVLIPLAVIAVLAAIAYSIAARAAQPREDTGTTDRPLPSGQQAPDAAHVRTTPERLADARRVHQ